MAFNGVVTADSLVDPAYGLFSVARVQKRAGSDGHWIDGYYVESIACGINARIVPQCSIDPEDWEDVFSNTDGETFFHVLPFTIIETYACENSIGLNAIDRRVTVVKQLDTISEYAVEQELWLGTSAQTDTSPIPAARWLTDAEDVTPTPSTAIKPRLALALVEQRFAAENPGVQATIHVTPLIAAILGDGVFNEEDGVLVTTQGSKVAISRGGDGDSGPAAGGSATKHWIYATGPVHVDLGSEELITVSASEYVDPVTNKVSYVAERPAAVYFDGCSWFGALADATL